MSLSPHKHMLGNKFLSFARSRLPVPNRPKPRLHRRRPFLNVTPVPFAPLVDAHAFQPPPPYSARPTDAAEVFPVPYNTPEVSSTSSIEGLCGSMGLGLGLDGVENGDGERFDGLGRLSGGFRPGGTHEALRAQVQQTLHERRRRTRANEQPERCQDVFYASVEVTRDKTVSGMPVKIRVRRKSAGSPTPRPRRWERGTISSELRRAASLERRASLSETGHATPWRV